MIATPLFVTIGFILITLITVVLFFFASNKNIYLLSILLLLAAIQVFISGTEFILDANSMPPRAFVIIVPSILLIIIAFVTAKGRALIDTFDMKIYTYLHTIRIGVEFVILALFLNKLMPLSMTFEGRNFDIFSGITAPIVAYFGYTKQKLSKSVILIWNIICLGLVLQVVTTGILSVPSPIQQLEFDQPNIAILYFPYIWLAGIVVPIVIFGHLLAIRKYFISK